ncbi:hypothetical protein JCM11491_004314 [Sporobolomyces phaffii]
MSKLLNLPGTASHGYHALKEPVASHTVSAGGIPDPTVTAERDVTAHDDDDDGFYDRVASIRESIRAYDANLSRLETTQLESLQPHHGPDAAATIAGALNDVNARLALEGTAITAELARLGHGVGRDEARRGHWDNVKAGFKRAVERQHGLEMAQRERVRDRVARQYRIVKPDASDEEVNQVLSSATTSTAPQVFQQALSGSQRTSAALSALDEARSRQSELAQIERSLVELSELVRQVADLVAEQDPAVVKVEHNAEAVHGDVEHGLRGVQQARVSAAAARHKRKICAAIGLAMVVTVIIVVVVQLKGSGSAGPGGDKEETKPLDST